MKCFLVNILLAVVLAVFTGCRHDKGAFASLDLLIERHQQLIDEKKQKIEQIKIEKQKACQGEDCLTKAMDFNKTLYNEYVEFQNDSALHYATINIEIAHRINDNKAAIDAQLDAMHVLTKAFRLDEAENMATHVDTTAMNQQQILDYYKIWSDIYLFKVEFYKGVSCEGFYQKQLTQYREKIASLAMDNNSMRLLNEANFLNDIGRTQAAIDMLDEKLHEHHSGERIFSVITSTLAFYYSTIGDYERQQELLAMSAASDIEGCIMENSALRQLAERLFDEGDIDKAYRYINLSVADANFYGTRLRNVQASQLVPRIIGAYQHKQERNYRNLSMTLIAMIVLALLLIAGVIALNILYKRFRALSENRKVINDKLNITVEHLEKSNHQLRERDKIKEQYLGRFLSLSSRLIDSSEKQRKALNRLAMEDKIKELKSQLKNQNADHENANLFYSSFDEAFLNIYPTFITEVNLLLQPGEQIVTKDDRQLTRELRILALIRLDIIDNQDIASILRSSITTIYTYRSRLKARAISKDTFEDDIKRIQSEPETV